MTSGEDDGQKSIRFRMSRLIIASGLESSRNMPGPFGRKTFQPPITHQENLVPSPILSSAKVKDVIVLGGVKSATDIVYESVKA